MAPGIGKQSESTGEECAGVIGIHEMETSRNAGRPCVQVSGQGVAYWTKQRRYTCELCKDTKCDLVNSLESIVLIDTYCVSPRSEITKSASFHQIILKPNWIILWRKKPEMSP
jgi:hypothetical protein